MKQTCHPGRAREGLSAWHKGAIRDPLGNSRDVEVGPGSARCGIELFTISPIIRQRLAGMTARATS